MIARLLAPLALALGLLAAAGPARAVVDIVEVTSPGGIEAWLVEERSIPFVALELRFGGGASLDRPGKRGAVNLMTALLEEGAGDLDAQGFATAREELAASFSFRAYDDAITVSARFLTENRDEALALLRSALTEPRFDEDAIERVRGQVLSIIRSDATDPDTVAGARFDALAYPGHPYATALDGTLESVAALRREDLLDAHRDVLVRDRLHVGAVGDIGPGELAELLDALLGDLPVGGAPLPPRIDYALGGGVTVVPFDTPQSVALFGQRGMDRDHPDFFAAFILNQILGGAGFEARLMEEVREKRGLTYGIYTFLLPRDHAELMMGQVASDNATVAEAIEVIRAEWRRMAEEGVTEEELAAAKTYLTGAYPLRFDGNGTIAGILAGMQAQGLGADYVLTRNAKVEAVTLEEINRVAGELLDPEGLHFVVVGQPEGLAASN
jgi:zinc protease